MTRMSVPNYPIKIEKKYEFFTALSVHPAGLLRFYGRKNGKNYIKIKLLSFLFLTYSFRAKN